MNMLHSVSYRKDVEHNAACAAVEVPPFAVCDVVRVGSEEMITLWEGRGACLTSGAVVTQQASHDVLCREKDISQTAVGRRSTLPNALQPSRDWS